VPNAAFWPGAGKPSAIPCEVVEVTVNPAPVDLHYPDESEPQIAGHTAICRR